MSEKAYKSIAYDKKLEEKPDEIIPIDCVGHIRPHATYDKDLGYGFDWMRIGDTAYGGNKIIYKGIVGKQYKRGTKTPIDDDVNETKGDFEAIDAMYESLEKEYNMASGAKVFIGGGKDKKRYHVPILALPRMRDIKTLKQPPTVREFEQKENVGLALGAGIGAALGGGLGIEKDIYFVKLELRLTITNSPKKLYWKLPDKYDKPASKLTKNKPIEIKCPELPVAACKDKKIEFEIGCSTTIAETIDIKLMAEDHRGKSKMVGVFRMWQNIPNRRKIVLVQVISDLGKGEKNFKDSKLKVEAESIKKYLSQALVIPDIEIILKFKMTDTGFFSKKNLNGHKTSSGNLLAYNEFKEDGNLYSHLHKYFTEKQKGYDNAVILYYVKEKTQSLWKKNKSKGVYEDFYAANLANTKLIIMSDIGEGNELEYAASHEIIHALKILHSFTNPEAAKKGNIAKHTFQAKRTDNLMDYAKYQFGLWYWQWQQMHKD